MNIIQVGDPFRAGQHLPQAERPEPCSRLLTRGQKIACVTAEVARLNGEYGLPVRVIFGDFKPPNVENSSARHMDFLMRIDLDDPKSYYEGEALFIARHEYAHAAFDRTEIEADQFAAEWAALRGQPRDEMLVSLVDLPASPKHPPGAWRVLECRAVYDRTVSQGRGEYAPAATADFGPPRPPDS